VGDKKMYTEWKELVIKNEYLPKVSEETMKFIYGECPLMFMPSIQQEKRYEWAYLLDKAVKYGQQNS
jgi:hypothetical protein